MYARPGDTVTLVLAGAETGHADDLVVTLVNEPEGDEALVTVAGEAGIAESSAIDGRYTIDLPLPDDLAGVFTVYWSGDGLDSPVADDELLTVDAYAQAPIAYSGGDAYATVDDVREQNTARRITGSSNPNVTQVEDWLAQTAGVLNGLLAKAGYALPVPTTAVSSLRTLEHYNALGAAAMVEQAAPTSDRRKEAEALWENAQEMLRDDLILLDAPKDTTTHTVRSPVAATPMFSRDMDL